MKIPLEYVKPIAKTAGKTAVKVSKFIKVKYKDIIIETNLDEQIIQIIKTILNKPK